MITIRRVTTKEDLKAFIRFPFKLYKDCPNWVPPLMADEMKTLRRNTNPSFEYCEAAYFLACKDHKIAGRIACIINRKANEKWGNSLMRFGWLDFIDDPEISKALLDAAAQWGTQKGMHGMHGPLGFTDFDLEGMLVEGFEHLPPIISPYNYPYYPQHLEKYGFQKSVDWLQYRFNASQPVPEKVERINNLISEKYRLRTLIFRRRKDVIPYGQKLFDTINKAWSEIYGATELTQKQIDGYIKSYVSFLRPELCCFVLDSDNHIVGFGISMPTLSRAFQKAKGRLFPFGWWHILRALHKYDTIDLYVNGVLPEWQHKGIHSLYYVAMNKAYIHRGVKIAISSSQLETNTNAVGIWDNYEKELLFRTRCFVKMFS